MRAAAASSSTTLWLWSGRASSTGRKHLGYADLCKELTTWRHAPGTEFLVTAPIHPLQQVLKDLDRAYRNFFEGRANLPRFKKKGRHDAFRYPDP